MLTQSRTSGSSFAGFARRDDKLKLLTCSTHIRLGETATIGLYKALSTDYLCWISHSHGESKVYRFKGVGNSASKRY